MAKKKSTGEAPEKKGFDPKSFLAKTKIKGLNKATTLNESPFSNITDWISTGSYALNKVLSGSYFKGIARGRITGLAGESGCGKSFICGNCVREAQRAGYDCVVFDTENAVDMEFLERIGVDTEKILYIPIQTVNEVKNTAAQLMDEYAESNPDGKLFIVIDSVTGLSTEKQLYDDVAKDGTAMDMGLFARQVRALAKVLTHKVTETNSTLLFTNHVWEKPPANPNMMPEKVMNGGQGLVYAASAIAYLTKKLEREEEQNLTYGRKEKRIRGAILRASTEKNRFVPQGAKAEIMLSFQKGMNKWYGMYEEAVIHNFLQGSGAWYTMIDPDTGEIIAKVNGKKNLYTKEVWQPILKKLNIKVEEEFKFATLDEFDENEMETPDATEDTDAVSEA